MPNFDSSTIVEENAQVEPNCFTNIRAEMFAVTEGLKAVAMRTEIDKMGETQVEVITDSKLYDSIDYKLLKEQINKILEAGKSISLHVNNNSNKVKQLNSK